MLKELALKTQSLRLAVDDLQQTLIEKRKELETMEQELKEMMQASGEDVLNLTEEEFQIVLSQFNDPERISIEVAYARVDKQSCIEVQVSPSTTIKDAIVISKILEAFPEIDLSTCKTGVFGTIRPLDYCVRAGDRVEIYRPVEA